MMRSLLTRATVAMVLVGGLFVLPVRAQQPTTPMAKATQQTFRVDVTLTRSQGTKPLGDSPFSLIVTGINNIASLRVGVDVPIGMVTSSTGHSEAGFKTIGTQIDAHVQSVIEGQYGVKVSISDTAVFADGADQAKLERAKATLVNAEQALARQKELFQKNLATQAVVTNAEAELRALKVEADLAAKAAASGIPSVAGDRMAFRTFTASNVLFLADGQTQEMTVATDRTSGETIKAAVKLTVVK
jgi:hypothetical protein